MTGTNDVPTAVDIHVNTDKPIAYDYNETLINTDTTGWQYDSDATLLHDGSYVVTWTAYQYAGDMNGIYAQKFNKDGTKQGSEVQVDTFTTDYGSSVTGLHFGGYVVAWTSNNEGVYLQRFDADGNTVGGQIDISTADYTQTLPSITGLSDGGYVVTWNSNLQDDSGVGIYSQRFSVNGEKFGDEVLVNTVTENSQIDSSITGLNDGGYVITWTSRGQDSDGDDYGVYSQRFNADGTKAGGETLVNTITDEFQYQSSVAALTNGGYVVTWTSNHQLDEDTYMDLKIMSQIFDANGDNLGSEIQVHTSISWIADGVNARVDSSVTGLLDGGYVVSWSSDAEGRTGDEIYLQKFTATGVKIGDQVQVKIGRAHV